MTIFHNKYLKALILVLAYLAGAAISILLVGILPVLGRHQLEIRHANTIWEENITHNYTDSLPWRNQYSRILIYNKNGVLIYSVINKPGKTAVDLIKFLNKWKKDAFAGKATIAITRDKFRESDILDFWLISGTPIFTDRDLDGVVFLIQDIRIVQESVIYFLILYTISFWLFVILYSLYQKKKKHLDDIQKQYVANITHQLKNPIATISALTESLSDGMVDDPDKQQLYYGRILKETQTQSRMISEILELSKLQSREGNFEKSHIKASEFFGKIIEKYSVLCEYSGLHFEASDELMELPDLYTNASALTQILDILLENTLKYVQDGGTVKLWCLNESVIKIVVSDNGPGIAAEDAEHIFERFYRCKDNNNRDGSGLGLAIASETAKMMKESLYVKSIPGKGTDFYLTLHRK